MVWQKTEGEGFWWLVGFVLFCLFWIFWSFFGLFFLWGVVFLLVCGGDGGGGFWFGVDFLWRAFLGFFGVFLKGKGFY